MKIRAAASILLAASLAAGLSGCNFFSPQATLKKYDPSDGVGANLGDVDVRNVLLVTEDGSRATLVMSVVNTGTDAKSLEVEYVSEAADAIAGRVSFDVEVPGQSIITTSATENDEQIVLEDIDAPAGSLFSVFLQSGTSEGTELRVPVLDGSLAEYDGLLPSPSPTPTPTPTVIVEPTPIPTTTPGTEPEAPLTEPETGPEVDTAE
ncbi:DNA modification methylase [Herbiconiux sp. L3-i23]|uniref:DNA modification methylase n=1 Tax=Herbiconiux sp. L3-i23 TaxID=2905871 RepID=UPI0020499CDC|nr:DNA modification methylase [Herbiconiux sp. L3-i23]BDI23741.1 hypothetical protein L3i23_25170 [Herbiconiux sp. L3-i23]